MNENLETSLFQEKFEDWSNIYREVGEDEAVMRETNRGKVITENTTKSEIVNDAKPCDVKKMVEGIPKAATMVADGEIACIILTEKCGYVVKQLHDRRENTTEY